jgi:hypothetical protein
VGVGEASQQNNIFDCVAVDFGDRVFSEHFQNEKFDMADLIDSRSVSINLAASNGATRRASAGFQGPSALGLCWLVFLYVYRDFQEECHASII